MGRKEEMMPELPVICQTEDCDKPAEAPHPCPYQEEINGDEDYRCTCCDDCRYECVVSI